MYITKLVLDGFKSYGTRTEIKGFDPEFNAITGLNGTGKSNILDSICFVLGITNLVNVRALNLVDLIYKSGQAGVTKATVTIFFDNSDPTKSPLNYEHQKEITVSRQIVVGGKNRYMINGIAVNNKTIFDFFKSVQLNVNNPHFLIMQGRITKVLNMKPPEILSMIEEAAGTSMYEHKKNLAQRTVEKKDTKLKEMDDMVLEQINPKMQRLKDERSQYFEYQKIQKEVESLQRITTAYKFTTAEQSLIKSQESLESIVAEIEALSLKRLNSESQVKSLEASITELNKKIDSEKGGTLCELEAQVHDLEKAEAKATAEYKNMENMVSSEVKKRKLLVHSLAEDEKAYTAKKAEMDKAGSVFKDLRETQQKDAEALAAAERKLQAVEQGKLSSEDGEDASLQDQLMAANEQLKDAETEVKMCAMQVEQAQKELKVKLPEFKQTESTLSNDSKDLEKKERELNNIENQLRNSNYQEGQLEQLEDQLKSITHDIRVCNDTVTKFGNRYPHLRFTYSDPEPNFDRRQVRGLLCTLFSVKDEKFARALETAAGGKLYNVVVENENVSSKLIKNGRLTKRTTFAPINKIQGHKMNQNLIRKAQNLVGVGNVFCAQDLIEYDRDYETIMAWAFGQTFICMDSNAAMKICDANDIQSKAVTLEGDVFDPAGIISGGAVVKTDPILRTLINLKNAERDVKVKQREQESIMQQIESLRVIAETDKVRKRLHTEVGMIRARVQITPHYQLKQEIQELKQKISEMSSRMDERKKEIKEKEKKVKELEYKMKNLKTIKDGELKAAQAELKKAEKRAEESKNRWIQREQEYENLNLEIQELEKAVGTGKTELATSEESIAKFKAESIELKQRLAEIQTTVKNMKSQVKMAEDEIGKKNSEIKSLVDKKEKLIKNACDCGVAVTSKEVEKTKAQEDISSARSLVNEMKRKYKWIETDREYFGQPNGLYDFNSNDPMESANKLRKLESMKEKLDKLVNVKALDVLGSQEEQFQEVLNKKVIVEEDRSKILSVIEELDVKKEEVIKTAWEQVNHDFNSILNTLLPGFNAKLQPVQGKDFMDGLQIKVGLGGIWKESLDELSGGQRSLVALSLILAMLLFRPAPLYILDEVDAALDQSHTQNIGQMLKKHFKQSQFIVVSLKDGMFTNANVLYRTSFVDGMSQVKRTTPNQQH